MIYGTRDRTEYEGEREFIVPDRPTCEACHGEAEFKNGTWRRRCRWCSGSALTGRDGKRSRRHQLRLRDAWRGRRHLLAGDGLRIMLHTWQRDWASTAAVRSKCRKEIASCATKSCAECEFYRCVLKLVPVIRPRKAKR